MGHEDTAPLAGSVCLAADVVHRAWAAHVADLAALPEWRALWLSTLQVLPLLALTVALLTMQFS